ncbi:MAG: thymidylate synthase [Candidatus Woesearchaeota archaeon]
MQEILSKIMEQTGSDGKKGWPCAVRDRIAYPSAKEEIVTDANVAVTFLWTVRDEIIPNLEKKNLALASNFYTPSGLVGMIRNILGNPYIRYIIMLGEEQGCNDTTSANVLRQFFEKGIGRDRKIAGFETAVYFDLNIPTEMINRVRENVQLIDLNRKMPKARFKEKIQEANKLLLTLEKKEPFQKPMVYGYEETTESYPYEGGPIVVHGNTIPETWVEVIRNINRYGLPNLMNANTDRWVKEINNMVAVIHDTQNTDLSLNPFLVPLTKEKIETYRQEVLSPILPKGKAYTYGNKLRAYQSNATEVKEMVSSSDYKDWEFGKGEHLNKNVTYKDNISETDQIQDIIDVLNKDRYSKACVAITWRPQEELMRKHKSSPCLVMIQAMVQDEKLNLFVFFRSHDMVQGWPENAYGCAAIQKYIADAIRTETGTITIVSGSGQIYNNYCKQVEDMLAKYPKKLKLYDPRGNYLIGIEKESIFVHHTDQANGRVLERFEGKTAREIRDKIFEKSEMRPDHAFYLGTEIQKAENCLKKGLAYEQDRA